MPLTQSAKKALRVSLRRRVFNLRRKRTLHDAVKKLETLAAQNKIQEAAAALPAAYQAIDKAAKCGVIKKNTAARKKSRLAVLLKKTILKA
jgi:small subunit ribosomal protein S20